MSTPADPEVVLSAKGLSKSFRIGFLRRHVTALIDSTFDVYRGEVFGLVGPNGAGKTTSIKILMGLIRPDSGSASIFGVDVANPAARLRVGFLPETPSFYDYLKPGELLAYYGQLYGLDHRQVRRRIPELLELVGLTGAEDKPIRKFSKGMTQRIGLAQALLPDSDLVLLDEPQSGLDPVGRKDVRDIITSLRERGKTVVFSSHILHDVEQICDRVAILVHGRVTHCGRVQELLGSTSSTVEITVRLPADVDRAPILAAGLRSEVLPDEALRIVVPSESACRDVLAAVIAVEGVVLDVERHRVRLEDVFLSVSAGADPRKEARR